MSVGCSMANLNQKINLGKRGTDYITMVVDTCMCTYNQIIQENDIGMDGQIELFDETGRPTGRIIGVQIKTGESYYDLNKLECSIPVDSHYDYWMNVEVPLIGIVCIMESASVSTAYWVDIKEYLSKNPNATKIKFNMLKTNEFSIETFRKYFYCLINKCIPQIGIDEALYLIEGNDEDRTIGTSILQAIHTDKVESWKAIFDMYDKSEIIDYSELFYNFSRMYGNPDCWKRKGMYEFSEQSRKFVDAKIKTFAKNDIIKLLSVVEMHYFDRGTMGQAIETIIKNIENSSVKLLDIVLDNSIDVDIRYDAENILAYQDKEFYIKNITKIKKMNVELTELIVEFMEKFGEYDIY